MNQDKIGKFIAECRKQKNLTQEQLANKLNISDRAVSKWERGLNLPDASLMIELCNILDINVNELLTGEIIKKENYMNKAEENLIELKEIIEKNNRRFLILEIVLIFTSLFTLLLLISTSTLVDNVLYKSIMIAGGFLVLIISVVFSFIIEKETGYYECSKCHHKYVPTYKQILFAIHMGWTRKLKCPKCHKKSWSKKVLSK